ncbi:MAG TPA: potassium transporter Kup [Polyangiaceae bacterium]|nr:potassium transporter Kup [Polyangiaceae bacterium]
MRSPQGYTSTAAPAWKLALPALGVVYGDIGTSPLYTLGECFHGDHGVAPTAANILGVLSLVFWALTFTVSIKYLTFILRADNEGEGGILALLALVPRRKPSNGKPAIGFIVLLVLFGAALLYGDGVITPAISVLSAIEGLEVATTRLKPAVLPLTVVTLVALFLVQRRGTAGIGRVFGPVMLLWFSTIGALGAYHLALHPGVLAAIEPGRAIHFFVENRLQGFFVLGGVVLAITGAEALYADMGHFGPGPIRRSWFVVVLPALILNYFGQGAHLLVHPEAKNPFYALVPSWALYPTVALATAATVVASQALISGAFSLTQQAVQLGYFPRITIVHTSKETEGQIYVPEINALLLSACVGLVLAFRSSSALAAAYGIAVTGTMGITTITYYIVLTRTWKWPVWRAAPLAAAFLLVDLAFFSATSTKILEGGWFPLLLASLVFVVMTTWHTGRRYLAQTMADAAFPLDLFLKDLASNQLLRVKGTAVFMASSANGVPPVLLHYVKHAQSLHETVVLLTVVGSHVPEVHGEDRLRTESLGQNFFRVTLRYGFMESPDIPRALSECASRGLPFRVDRTSYFLGRETLLPEGEAPMNRWRKRLFSFISRNAVPATAYFGLPPGRVVELGMQVRL